MQKTFSFSEEEKKFFEIYQELLIKYYNQPQKLSLFLELKALELGIEDYPKLVEKFHEFLREYVFFKSKRGELESILEVKPQLINVLKKYPYFVEYRVTFTFPSSAVYRGFKWRKPLLLAGGNDGKVRVWRYLDGKFHFLGELGEEVGKFPAYELYRGHLFYAAGSKLNVYYLPSGKLVKSLEVGKPVTSLNLEGDTLYLFKRVGDIAIKQSLELREGEVFFGPADPIAPSQVETGETDTAAVEKKLLKLKGGKILLLTAERREVKLSFEKGEIYDVGYTVNDILPLKNILVLALSGSPPAIFDLEEGKPKGKLNLPITHSYRVKKNPTRDEIALSHTQNLISIWDLNTLQPLKVLEGYFIDAIALDYSPDGKLIAAGGEGRDVNIWDTESWKMVKDLELPQEGITALKFSPDGKYLAVGAGNDIYLVTTENWEVEKVLSYHEDLIADLTFIGDKLVSTGWDGKALLWNTESGEVERIIESSEERIWKVLPIEEGKYLALADWKGKVSIYQTEDWSLVATFVVDSQPTALAADRNRLYIGRKDGKIQTVRLEREESLASEGVTELSLDPSEEAVGIATFSGNLLTYTTKGNLRIWDPNGDKVFSAKVEGELKEAENLREPRLELKIFENTYVVRKDGYFFGGKGWENYVSVIKGLEPVEDKTPFLKEITKRELLQEL
jgi:WD40 repeat protein